MREPAVRRWLSRRRAGGSEPYRFVFVVTYARSGSTVLQAILASLDGFWMTGENAGALEGLFDSYRRAKQAREEQGGEPRRAPGDPWRGADRIDPERYAAALARVFVEEILQPPTAARVIGFKEVRYFDRMDDFHDYLGFMQRVFAPSLIVFNKRRAEDVAQSGWWKVHETAALVAEIERFDGLAARYAGAHPEGTIVVDYDAYCRDVAALRPLVERLGRPFDPAALRRILATRLTH